MANPLLIFGYMHTGTSLLFNILDSCTEISSFHKEINVIQRRNSLKEVYQECTTSSKRIAFFKDQIKYTASDIDQATIPFTGDLVSDYFLFWEKVAEGKRYYLDGSPNNYLFDDLITSKIKGDYKAIAIIRDPRDTIASKKKRWQTTNLDRYGKDELLKKKAEKGYSTVWDSISIQKSYEKMAQIDTSKCMVIRYEDLVSDYDTVMTKVGDFLGIEKDKFINPEEVNFSNKADQKDKRKGVYKNLANYVKTLTPSEIYAIQLLCRKSLSKYQFPKMNINILGRLKATQYVITFFTDIITRLVKRLVLFGPKEFLNYVKMSITRFK